MQYCKPNQPFEITFDTWESWALSGLLPSHRPEGAADRTAPIILAQSKDLARHEATLVRWEAVPDPIGRSESAIRISTGPDDSASGEATR